MVAKGGAALLAPAGAGGADRRLLPLATLITPNLPEAEALPAGRVRAWRHGGGRQALLAWARPRCC